MLDAFHVAAVGTRADIQRAASACTARSPEGALLAAVLAQYDGDVDGAVRMLRDLYRRLSGTDRAAVADVLAPILVMRHENAAVLALARALDDAGWRASAHAFRALALADAGDRVRARAHANAAVQALDDERDDVIRFRVLQRLARAAFYLDEHERAIDYAYASAQLCAASGAWRSAAAAYSIAYNVHHNVTGAIEEADRFARLWHEAALRSQDESFAYAAAVAEYGLAVQLGDGPRIASLERAIRIRMLPQQYTERFSYALAAAIARGANDLLAMRTLLQLLRDSPGRSRGETALCSALIAVAQAAVLDDDGARRSMRAATAALGRVVQSDPAYERRYRRLARSAAAAACVLLGDDVRAARIVSAKESQSGEGEERLPALMRSETLRDAPAAFRGVAKIFAAAFERRRALQLPAGLTRAEAEVLKLLGRGWSAGKIARETQRSVNTVYNHTRSILSKLDASRASEAVVIARERGLLS